MKAAAPNAGVTKHHGGHGQRVSRIVFTLNNYTKEEYEWFTSWTRPKWMIVGKEVGENGTPHLQGAAVLGGQMAFSTLKQLEGFKRAHIEPMHGTPLDSAVYCAKEDKYAYEHGELPKEGKRSDVQRCVERIKEGSTIRELAQDVETAAVVVRYYKGLTIVRSLNTPERDATYPPKVFWLHGPTGVGKTRLAHELGQILAPRDVWISNGDLEWHDGYDGQRCVILDELRAKNCKFVWLLRLLDRYPLNAPVKGAFVNWNPEFIFITSSHSPDECFATRKLHKPEDMEQLNRRITGGTYELSTGGTLSGFTTRLAELQRRIVVMLKEEKAVYSMKIVELEQPPKKKQKTGHGREALLNLRHPSCRLVEEYDERTELFNNNQPKPPHATFKPPRKCIDLTVEEDRWEAVREEDEEDEEMTWTSCSSTEEF